jgi:hypothetical protein
MIARVASAALHTYREKRRRVAGTAFIVFGAIAAVDVTVAVLVADGHVARPWAASIVSAVAAVISMAGVVFYAGVLDKVVAEHHHGEPELTIRQVWAVLPLRRLAGADVLLVILTAVGFALGVVPGVIAFTLFALVGPVIVIEDHTVLLAFRRSSQLARHHFWTTLLLVTLPVGVEQAALHAIHYEAVFDHPVVPALLLNGLLGGLIGSFVGLLEVVLAHELIRLSPHPGGPAPVSIPHRVHQARLS